MRTTLDIDRAVLEAARAVAKSSRKTIGEIISVWARKGLTMKGTPTRHSRFPIFDVPDNAEPIQPSIVSELLADEDLPAGR